MIHDAGRFPSFFFLSFALEEEWGRVFGIGGRQGSNGGLAGLGNGCFFLDNTWKNIQRFGEWKWNCQNGNGTWKGVAFVVIYRAVLLRGTKLHQAMQCNAMHSSPEEHKLAFAKQSTPG